MSSIFDLWKIRRNLNWYQTGKLAYSNLFEKGEDDSNLKIFMLVPALTLCKDGSRL